MANRAIVEPTAHVGTARSLNEIMLDIIADIRRIIRAELQLARTEINENVVTARKAGAAFGAAVATGILAGMCFVGTCIAALALALPVWLASLITGALLASLAAVAYRVGRAKLKRTGLAPRRTIQTIKDDIPWAKQRTE